MTLWLVYSRHNARTDPAGLHGSLGNHGSDPYGRFHLPRGLCREAPSARLVVLYLMPLAKAAK